MEDVFIELIKGLPTAGVLFYIWFVTNNGHIKEREQWRGEISEVSKTLAKTTEQVSRLQYIIENYVLKDGKTRDRA